MSDGIKVVGATILAILFVAAVSVGIATLAGAIQWGTADIRGKLNAREQIHANGSYRIDAYEHFFNLCASVQTNEQNLDAQYDELNAAQDVGDKENVERIQANISGLRSAIADAVNQYNADANKSYTVGQFRSSSLPYQLSTDAYRKGVHTKCTV
jgi:hypothetical protein